MTKKSYRTKEKSLPEVRIEIKPSKILRGQVGVFSTRPISQDTVVVLVEQFSKAQFFNWKFFNTLDTITQKKVMDYCSGTKLGFYAPKDLNYISIGWHLNHSCEPNIGFDQNYNFIASRRIKAGEELTWDYSYDETNPNFSMKCTCKTKSCRKKITGNDWKLLITDKKKFKYLSPQLKKLK